AWTAARSSLSATVPHAMPKSATHRAMAATAYGVPGVAIAAAAQATAVVPRTRSAPAATGRAHAGPPAARLRPKATKPRDAAISSAPNLGTKKGASKAGA